MNQMLAVAGVVAALCLSTGHLAAQGRQRGGNNGGNGGNGGGRGNFDPAQFQQRMMDRYKEQLEVTSDDEWKIIGDRVEKVMIAQREASMGRRGGFGGGRRGGKNRPRKSMLCKRPWMRRLRLRN